VDVIRITDRDDPRVDDYRNLTDPEPAVRQGAFVAEGRLVTGRLLQSRFGTRSVMVTDAGLAALPPFPARLTATPVYVVSPATMNAIVGFRFHRGCVAIGERGPSATPLDVTRVARRLVILERVADADNVGAIFRNAAAFGVDGVLLDAASTDPLYRKALRTSMGSTLRVPFARMEPLAEGLRQLRAEGVSLVALTPSPDATPLSTLAPSLRTHRTALIVGHEGEGLLPGTLEVCDMRACIPMAPGVDSLNVATALAIGLYELTRMSTRPPG
jgi:tRNA G18 (ribose-2'-O)-methylase SpoU